MSAAKYSLFGVLGLIGVGLSLFLFARFWGWWTWHQYRTGHRDHDDVANAQCTNWLIDRRRHSDAEYRRGEPDMTPRDFERWNTSWALCYRFFPQYPWHVSHETNGLDHKPEEILNRAWPDLIEP